MRTDHLHVGDLVECEKLGLTFRALVVGLPGDQQVDVEPKARNISYRRLRAREVTKVLSRAGEQLRIGEAV